MDVGGVTGAVGILETNVGILDLLIHSVGILETNVNGDVCFCGLCRGGGGGGGGLAAHPHHPLLHCLPCRAGLVGGGRTQLAGQAVG